ncbi:hypothetical protein VE01_00410 [Pseudogymnoascus verrucosus]|uniref:Uncharacterized protein n=1 Tax=Pseudogymnoascus verrucosus TaxID=342668 RepID=A0A2P2SXW2_9PEZI|nr:uncharacterized protein VE01_00410 [Pseudogymnoascus verrucosus]OBU01698.1 hypothetical protein VE01_00410 [Pseudogymnoascus verrucosus]
MRNLTFSLANAKTTKIMYAYPGMPGAPIKKYPLQMDALPVPRGWVPDAWFKAYNAADSQIYHLVGRDCRISKRKRESGETRERALMLWERYPINKVMWAERGREDRGAEVAEVAVVEEEEEEESGDESEEEEEDNDGDDEEEESGDEEEVEERGAEIVWEQQEVEESEEGEDTEMVDAMDVDGDSSEEAYDMSYLFEEF